MAVLISDTDLIVESRFERVLRRILLIEISVTSLARLAARLI